MFTAKDARKSKNRVAICSFFPDGPYFRHEAYRLLSNRFESHLSANNAMSSSPEIVWAAGLPVGAGPKDHDENSSWQKLGTRHLP
jgi:hypothetical protein